MVIPQPFSLFLMIFTQADLKTKQTSANILLNCLLLSILVQFNSKYQKSDYIANNPNTAILRMCYSTTRCKSLHYKAKKYTNSDFNHPKMQLFPNKLPNLTIVIFLVT